jgi:hypothetical protein
MIKSQLVSMITLFITMSAHVQAGATAPVTVEYQCQQDPTIVGVGTELTVTYAAMASQDFTATLTRTATTFPPRSSTQTFIDLTRAVTFESTTYEGEGFKLTVSPDATVNPRLGRVFTATLVTEDTGSEGQKLFCKQGDAVGLPAVTGTN